MEISIFVASAVGVLTGYLAGIFFTDFDYKKSKKSWSFLLDHYKTLSEVYFRRCLRLEAELSSVKLKLNRYEDEDER